MIKPVNIKCTQCSKIKKRYSNSLRNLYYSKKRRRWQNAHICHVCFQKNLKAETPAELTTYHDLPKYNTNKSCSSCEGPLELARYKTCTKCKPSLGEDTGFYGPTIRETLNFRVSELPLLGGGFMRR